MSRWISDLVAELRAAYIAAVPSVVPAPGAPAKNGVAPHGVWVTTQASRVPWEDFTLPVGGIEIGDLTASEEYGDIVQGYEFQVRIWYAAEQTWNGLEIAEVLEDLRDAYAQLCLTTGNVIRVGDMSWSDSVQPNADFVAKGAASRSGYLVLTLQVGQSLNG